MRAWASSLQWNPSPCPHSLEAPTSHLPLVAHFIVLAFVLPFLSQRLFTAQGGSQPPLLAHPGPGGAPAALTWYSVLQLVQTSLNLWGWSTGKVPETLLGETRWVITFPGNPNPSGRPSLLWNIWERRHGSTLESVVGSGAGGKRGPVLGAVDWGKSQAVRKSLNRANSLESTVSHGGLPGRGC